jgi:hypothetical protein
LTTDNQRRTFRIMGHPQRLLRLSCSLDRLLNSHPLNETICCIWGQYLHGSLPRGQQHLTAKPGWKYAKNNARPSQRKRRDYGHNQIYSKRPPRACLTAVFFSWRSIYLLGERGGGKHTAATSSVCIKFGSEIDGSDRVTVKISSVLR